MPTLRGDFFFGSSDASPRPQATGLSPRTRHVFLIGRGGVENPRRLAHCGDPSLPSKAYVVDLALLNRKERFTEAFYGLIIREIEP